MSDLTTPFFTVRWMPPMCSGLLPVHPSRDDHPFMAVGWKAKPGTTYYPWRLSPALSIVHIY